MALRIKRLENKGSGTSLIFKDIDRAAQLKTLTAGTGVTITDDAAGNLTFAAGGAEAIVGGSVTSSTLSANINQDIKRTSASVTVNASITYVDVTGLLVTVVPGTYRFSLRLPSTVANGTHGIKYAFHYVGTVVSVLEASSTGFAAAAVATQHTTTATDVADLYSSASITLFTDIEGTIVVTTGGTVQVQVAQNTSGASNTVALLGGTAEFTRIV